MKPKKLRRPALMLSVCLITTMQSVFSQGVFLTNEHSQIVPTDNTNKEFTVMPLVTVVELKNSDDLNAKQFKGYQFPGVLDGLAHLKWMKTQSGFLSIMNLPEIQDISTCWKTAPS